MSTDYQQELARIRDYTRKVEGIFRKRYSSGPAAALSMVQRWRRALSSERLDWNELSAIRDEARVRQATADISFFSFIKTLESDFVSLRQAELEAGDGIVEGGSK